MGKKLYMYYTCIVDGLITSPALLRACIIIGSMLYVGVWAAAFNTQIMDGDLVDSGFIFILAAMFGIVPGLLATCDMPEEVGDNV